MYNCRYSSNKREAGPWAGWCLTVLMLVMCAGCTPTETLPLARYAHYVVTSDGTEGSDRWAEYLYNHLDRRSGQSGLAQRRNSPGDDNLQIVVALRPEAGEDYAASYRNARLTLTARHDEAMLWLLYQFMAAAAAEDARLEASDLPPALLNLQAAAGNFAFEYRGIYTPSNADPDRMGISATHNPDWDWALWGHNLRKLFGGQLPEEVQAQVDGQRNKTQICFSSPRLYQAIEQYILDKKEENGGKTVLQRFALLPEDNSLVCTCPECTRAGNTPRTATPAVTHLLEKLARRFPQHRFFTSAYLTTRQPPAHPLPANAGVIVSAMEMPLETGWKARREAAAFQKLIASWKEVASCIYVWDYLRNFDDYLTPYPCLRLLQERLRTYKEWGVRGIFLNGSGDDYASLDDMQTYVLAALLVNPACNADSCAGRYLRHFYPQTGSLLATHYLRWEDSVARRHGCLPRYGGIGSALEAWMDSAEINDFIDELDKKSKKTAEAERARLNRLLTALQFTRLEMMRLPGQPYDARKAGQSLQLLEGHRAFADMQHYREANGDLDTYILEWRRLLAENAAPPDLMAGTVPQARTALDEDYPDPAVLTDGRYALPTDYHTGWLIISARETVLQIPAGKLPAQAVMEFSLLAAPSWRIYLPARIEVKQPGGKPLAVLTPAQPAGTARTKYKLKCRLEGIRQELPVEIHLTQREGVQRPTLALDEIDVF